MNKLFLDLETAPNTALVWGLFNQNIGIDKIIEDSETLCWAAKWYGDKAIMFDSKHQSGNKKMIERIHSLVDQADAVIHFNGKKFDMPTLNKEFLLNGLMPPQPYHQIDLYQIVRSSFRFPSNKLDYVLKALGMEQKVPHKGIQLWIDCMNGDEEAWELMEEYNRKDVEVMEPLYEALLPWIYNHPNHALYTDPDRPMCSNCGSTKMQSRGYATTKTQIYRRFQCQDCFTWNRERKTVATDEQKRNTLVQVR